MQDRLRRGTDIRLGILFIATSTIIGCIDQPSAPLSKTPGKPTLAQSALADAPMVLSQALAGIHRRGEQDDMLRREADLPGFGGFFIDSLDRMVVYMKPSTNVSSKAIQQALNRAYVSREEPRIREIISKGPQIRVLAGQYTLSELIAVENRLALSPLRIPGFVGVGTSLILNRVVLGVTDNASIPAALEAALSIGVPREVLIVEAWGPVYVTGTWTDRYRNTKAGIKIVSANSTTNNIQQELLSHGFNVRSQNGTSYFMTAAHGTNTLHGINGYVGDTVFQAVRNDGAIGVMAVNPPWPSQNCPINALTGAPYDFCLDADVALGTFINGVSGDRKVGTSTYEGQNGSPGTNDINNFYPIQSVATPEWIATTNNGVHKSGYQTGTTTGAMQLPDVQVRAQMCWGAPYNCPNVGQPGVWVFYWNLTRVNHAGWGLGDSGGPVFAGNGSPYFALGIQVAGSGNKPNEIVCTNGMTCAFYFNRWSAIEAWLGLGTLNPTTVQ